jgi:hypothetical protein
MEASSLLTSCQYYWRTDYSCHGDPNNKNEQAQPQQAKKSPLAPNKQRHLNANSSLLPNGKPSRRRSPAGPEYFSRNGQQLVLGAASSPKPEPSQVACHRNSFKVRHILMQPYWSFRQPISCPRPPVSSFHLAAPSGRRGCGGHISWPSHLLIYISTTCY